MGLIKSRGNMYDWVTHHWSPVRGCLHACPYCYTQKFDKDWDKPRLDEKDLIHTALGGRLVRPPKVIFVGSKCDMWGSWVPHEWIQRVLDRCLAFPDNTYVFQSKNPGRFLGFQQPPNALYGTTLETNKYPEGFNKMVPSPMARYLSMVGFQARKFITIEPIMKFSLPHFLEMIRSLNPEFVTIGADSKGHNLPEPTWFQVQVLIDALNMQKVEIRKKTNLERLRH